QALYFKVWRLEIGVGDDQDARATHLFDFAQGAALLVEQVGSHVDGTMARTSALRSLMASSSIRRRMDSARDLVSRMVPWPVQRGQTMLLVSPREGRRR